MTPDGAIATAAVRLAAAGIEKARGEARLLLAYALGTGRDGTLSARLVLTPAQEVMFEDLVARRAAREPLAYITGHKEFWSVDLKVGPGVLVPRADTETLIEAALRAMPDRNAPLAIADLGTGTGAILLAVLAEFPAATGVGFESSPEAFAYAQGNAGGQSRAEMRLADWDAASGPFDLIFSNPPYIPGKDIESLEPEVRLYEPRAALDGGADGLDAYRALANLLPRLLKKTGRAVLEIGIGQADAMELLFPNLEIVEISPGFGGDSPRLGAAPRKISLEKPGLFR